MKSGIERTKKACIGNTSNDELNGNGWDERAYTLYNIIYLYVVTKDMLASIQTHTHTAHPHAYNVSVERIKCDGCFYVTDIVVAIVNIYILYIIYDVCMRYTAVPLIMI